ncbi:MAG: C1 family peptidase [Verrucomicrobiota bacterium]
MPKGTRIESLPAGKRSYTDVTVRSVNAATVVITHSGGLASVPLSDLPAEWQRRFDYDPAAAEAAIEATKSRPVESPTTALPSTTANRATTPLEDLLLSLGEPATLRKDVDLRSRFFEYGLYPKDQGRRPSCSVFAVVSALEFQNATLVGQAEKFSEEYLIWATRKVLGQTRPAAVAETEDEETAQDAGFSLSEVVTALRTYGVPRQSDMPNTFGSSMRDIAEPDAGLIEQARSVRQVAIHRIPARENAQAINGLVHALNAGVPPAVGLRWPHERSIRNGYLSRQQPVEGYAHAVTLVGYRCETGRIEDAVFIFKNSWGPRWGQGGFGMATWEYLHNNLQVAVVLDVQTGGTP